MATQHPLRPIKLHGVFENVKKNSFSAEHAIEITLVCASREKVGSMNHFDTFSYKKVLKLFNYVKS